MLAAMSDELRQVVIGTVGTPVEGDLVKAMLGAHGIHSNISGQHHAAALGGMAGALIRLDIQVAAKDAELASSLIAASRVDDAEADDALTAEALAAGGVSERQAARQEMVSVGLSRDRKRKIGLAAVTSVVITFGTGHMIAGAWLRAMLLVGWEVMALKYLAAGQKAVGLAMLCGGIVLDLVGSQLMLRKQPALSAPARVVKS
jgi:hypothetical protein